MKARPNFSSVALSYTTKSGEPKSGRVEASDADVCSPNNKKTEVNAVMNVVFDWSALSRFFIFCSSQLAFGYYMGKFKNY